LASRAALMVSMALVANLPFGILPRLMKAATGSRPSLGDLSAFTARVPSATKYETRKSRLSHVAKKLSTSRSCFRKRSVRSRSSRVRVPTALPEALAAVISSDCFSAR
jgi:hypothetical protein